MIDFPGHGKLLIGNALVQLQTLPAESVHCCVTSPPYFGLRDYGHEEQIGLEETPAAYVAKLVAVFEEVRRVLRGDGTLWLNLGDSYNAGRDGGHAGGGKQATLARHSGIVRSGANVQGCKPKDLIGIPWSVAFALRDAGWYLRSDIIWSKPNPMPESVTDRPTKAHEYLFLLSKSERYWYDAEAIQEPATYQTNGNKKRSWGTNETSERSEGSGEVATHRGIPWAGSTRNRRSVWEVCTQPYKGAHFAVMPSELVRPCVLAGCQEGGTVLDPFAGSGTTLAVAKDVGRRFVGIELNPKYAKLIQKRVGRVTPPLPFTTVQPPAASLPEPSPLPTAP